LSETTRIDRHIVPNQLEETIMALPQDISPVNSELMESLVRTSEIPWTPQSFDREGAFMKVLWTGTENGRATLLFRC
jgi:hypothetical protein